MLALSRRDVLELLPLSDCIAAVERAFRLHAEQQTFGPGVLGVSAGAGSVHVKVAGLRGERSYVAAKVNANFPDNPRRHGLPTIQGTVMLADAETGRPLAVMDSASVTALRTGAATAVAASATLATVRRDLRRSFTSTVAWASRARAARRSASRCLAAASAASWAAVWASARQSPDQRCFGDLTGVCF